MDKSKIIVHWIESSDSDYRTMNLLYRNKDFPWSLFLGHLVIEKLLKAYYVKKMNDYPPLMHNLHRIAEKAGLSLTDEQVKILVRITTFNLNARYDDYKKTFYKTCSKLFTDEWINNIKSFRKWIKDRLSE